MRNILKFLVCMFFAAIMIQPIFAAGNQELNLTIPFDVVTEGESSDDLFDVTIEQVDEEAPMPEVTELHVKAGETGFFGPICYTTPNTYRYKITQKAGGNADIEYDTTTFVVSVMIMSNDKGKLSCAVWAQNQRSGKQKTAVVFTNLIKNNEADEANKKENSESSSNNSSNSSGSPSSSYSGGPSSSSSSAYSAKENIQTGDRAPYEMYVMIAAIIAIMGGFILIIGSKRKENKE